MPGSTLLRRARHARALTLSDAARHFGVKPPTVHIWENTHAPSLKKTWELIAALAQGEPAEQEVHPVFLASYYLLGHRFLDDERGRLVVFHDPRNADAAADTLEQYELDRVTVVPCWRSALDEVAPKTERVEFDAVPYLSGREYREETVRMVHRAMAALADSLAADLRARADQLQQEDGAT